MKDIWEVWAPRPWSISGGPPFSVWPIGSKDTGRSVTGDYPMVAAAFSEVDAERIVRDHNAALT